MQTAFAMGLVYLAEEFCGTIENILQRHVLKAISLLTGSLSFSLWCCTQLLDDMKFSILFRSSGAEPTDFQKLTKKLHFPNRTCCLRYPFRLPEVFLSQSGYCFLLYCISTNICIYRIVIFTYCGLFCVVAFHLSSRFFSGTIQFKASS